MEIIKTDAEYESTFFRKINVTYVGSYSTVETLGKLAESGKLPYRSIGIVDGDRKSDALSCLSLPGDLAPEKLVFSDLKKISWNGLDNRFGIGAGTLFKILDDAMLLTDHHKWTAHVGDQLHKSKAIVWELLAEEWVKQCLPKEEKESLVAAIRSKLC